MNKEIQDVIASIYDRLKNLARQTNRDFQSILQYYGMERFLYRLSLTKYHHNFILKGGLLVNAWSLPSRRITRDIDFRGFISNDIQNIEEIFKEVCLQVCQEDGLYFDPDTINSEITQVDMNYDGIRVKLVGYLGKSRIPIQVDIGFSDMLSPKPILIDYPNCLPDLPKLKMLGYSPETVIAEKIQTIVRLGGINSRLKDYYDIWLLSETFNFKGKILQKAIRTTFENRQTTYPNTLPFAMTIEFAKDNQKNWERTVIKKMGLMSDQVTDFSFVITRLGEFLIPLMTTLQNNEIFSLTWNADTGWV